MTEQLEKSAWLMEILKSLCLEQFFNKIVLDLQVTQIEHFEFVRVNDLLKVGMARPAARRLLDCLRRRRQQIWRRNLISRLVPIARIHGGARGSTGSSTTGEDVSQNGGGDAGNVVGELQASMIRLTCLIREEDILLHEQLGQGSFGVVRRGEWVDHSGRSLSVAVKVLKQQPANQTGVFDDFIKEVQAMHQLSHQNIITLYGIVLASPMMMVTELASLGNLRDFIRKQCSQISLAVLHRFCEQTAEALSYMQKHRLVHGDVACRNLLLVSKHTVKICDFGLMCSVPKHEQFYTLKAHMKVPLPWCAPETLKSRQLSHSSDVWMFGVCVWEMLSLGETPWPGLNGSEILHTIDVRGDRLSQPILCSHQMYQLLLKCWAQRPSDRPCFATLQRLLNEATPRVMRAVRAYSEPQRLSLCVEEEVVIIDGRAENHWWTGQSLSSWEIGTFPRNLVQPMDCGLHLSDISRPLDNSFIHTGHGSSTGESNWGSPAFIDRMYLSNPVEPGDKYTGAHQQPVRVLPPTGSSAPANSVLNSDKYDIDQWHLQTVNGSASSTNTEASTTPIRPKSLPSYRPPLALGSSTTPSAPHSLGGGIQGSMCSVDTFTSDSNSTADIARADSAAAVGGSNPGATWSGAGFSDSSYYNVMDKFPRYYQPPSEVESSEVRVGDSEPDPFDTSAVPCSFSPTRARSSCSRTDQMPVAVLPIGPRVPASCISLGPGNSILTPGSSALTSGSSTFSPPSIFTPASTLISGSNTFTPASTLTSGSSIVTSDKRTLTPASSTLTSGSSTFASGSSTFTPASSTFTPDSIFTPESSTFISGSTFSQAHSTHTPDSGTFTPTSSTYTPSSGTFTPASTSTPGNCTSTPLNCTFTPGSNTFIPPPISGGSSFCTPNSITQQAKAHLLPHSAGVTPVNTRQLYRPPLIASEARQISSASHSPNLQPVAIQNSRPLSAVSDVSGGVSLPRFGPFSGSIPTLIPERVYDVNSKDSSVSSGTSAPVSIKSVLADFDPLTIADRSAKPRAHYLRAPPSSVRVAEVRPFRRSVSSASSTQSPAVNPADGKPLSHISQKTDWKEPPMKLDAQRCGDSSFKRSP